MTVWRGTLESRSTWPWPADLDAVGLFACGDEGQNKLAGGKIAGAASEHLVCFFPPDAKPHRRSQAIALDFAPISLMRRPCSMLQRLVHHSGIDRLGAFVERSRSRRPSLLMSA